MKVNYHTHTSRCHHAEGEDRDYVLSALDGGFDALGFADHTPWPFRSGFVSPIRMTMDDLPGYLQSIRALRQEFADRLPIHIGLECEYFPRYRDHLLALREMGVSYFILGQHYNGSEEDSPYIGNECKSDDGVRRYADQCAEAIATGLFCYLAHPDLYMRPRLERGFDRVAEEAANTICQAAKEYDVPLEYNLLGHDLLRRGQTQGYPYPAFWSVVQKWQNTTILGVDAHQPEKLRDTVLWDEGVAVLKNLGLHRVETIALHDA